MRLFLFQSDPKNFTAPFLISVGTFLSFLIINLLSTENVKRGLRRALFIVQTKSQLQHTLAICRLKQSISKDYILVSVCIPLCTVIYLLNTIKAATNRTHKVNCDYIEKHQSVDKFRNFFHREFYCSCRNRTDLSLPVPMNPFSKNNRLIVCLVFAAYLHTILNIFESSLLNFYRLGREQRGWLKSGILLNLLVKIGYVLIVGFHFYPIMLCVELKRKSTISYALCMIYSWFMLFYCVIADALCQEESDGEFFYLIKHSLSDLFGKQTFPSLKHFNSTRELNNSKKEVTIESKSLYENLTYYIVLSTIAIFLTMQSLHLIFKDIFALYNRCYKASNTKNDLNDKNSKQKKSSTEIRYTIKLLKSNRNKSKTENSSFGFCYFLKQKFGHYIYKPRKHYRFSKQFLSTQFILIMLLYFLTCTIIKNTNRIAELMYGTLVLTLDWFVNKILIDIFLGGNRNQASMSEFIESEYLPRMHVNNKSGIVSNYLTHVADEADKERLASLFKMIEAFIRDACICTSLLYAVQIFLFVRQYQKIVLNAYRGVYAEIPKPSELSNIGIVSGSIRFRFV